MQDNLFIENLKQSTGMRIYMFLIILLISSLIGVAISFAFMFAGDTGMKIAQGLSSIMMFVVPPIVYYFITRKEHQMKDLGFRETWNGDMSFGSALAKLEEYLKTLEETAQVATEKMLNVNTFGGLLLNLLIIALIPAIGEEMTFRGVLQQSLTRKMNPHLAIFLSAAIL